MIEPLLWIPEYREWGELGFIAEIGNKDSYHKYRSELEGTQVSFITMINSYNKYPPNDYSIHQGWISCRLKILNGRFKNQEIHFFRVKIVKGFPFEWLMERAIKS